MKGYYSNAAALSELKLQQRQTEMLRADGRVAGWERRVRGGRGKC